MKGPTKKTFTDGLGDELIFKKLNGKISVHVHSVHITGSVIVNFKDAQVRELRNWLNWYLDNK